VEEAAFDFLRGISVRDIMAHPPIIAR
jgi:hypothetical protein